MHLGFGVTQLLQVHVMCLWHVAGRILLKSFFSLAPQLVHHGNIDFLVSDYLSEITMSLLSAMKHRQPVSLSQSSGHHALSWLLIINFAVSYIFKAYGVYYGLSCKHEATAEASEGEGY